MLLAVATPMHMMAPISAGTLSVVWVRKSNEHDAGERRGQRRDDDERVQPGLEVDHDQHVDQHDGEDKADEQAEVGAAHGLHLAAHA